MRIDHFRYSTVYLWVRLFTDCSLLSCRCCHFLQRELIVVSVSRL